MITKTISDSKERRREYQREYSRRRRAAKKDEIRVSNRRYQENHRDKVNAWNKKSYFQTTYGIAPEEKEAIFERQGHVCAICNSADTGSDGVWHLDHCHSTGVIRGVLCVNCNMGLGQFKDNTDALLAAVAYLKGYHV